MYVNARFQFQKLCLITLSVLGALLWVLNDGQLSSAGPYLDSAHGDSTAGVYRLITPPADYARGNCAHCHEQHASIGGDGGTANGFALFYDHWTGDKCDLFCFQCHSQIIGAAQLVTNYPYSVRFGGDDVFYGNIHRQFCYRDSSPENCGSNHNLGAIRDFIQNKWEFPADPEPCSGCHNAHRAERNYPASVVVGKLNTAISRPSSHQSLWGDDENERMDDYAFSVGGVYQAPFFGDSSSGRYEPDGSTTEPPGGWGSNVPDYVSFCLDCHQVEQYDPDRGATVKAINWSQERHGGYPSNTCVAGQPPDTPPDPDSEYEGALKPPYDTYEPNQYNYVLSCLDCHEPHGSKMRLHLLRRMVNGADVAPDTGSCDEWTDWADFCGTCHIPAHPDWGGCMHSSCHGGHGTRWTGAGGCNGEPMF